MSEKPRNREIENEKNSVFYIEMMRHADRFAGKGTWIDPETGEEISWDDTQGITPAGFKNAEEHGESLPQVDHVTGVSSLEGRAAQTSNAVVKGSGKDQGLGTNRVFGFTYKELGPEGQALVKKVRPLIKAEAEKFPNYGRLTAEERSPVRHEAQGAGLREAMKDETFVQEAAEGMAYNLWALKKITEGTHESNPGMKALFPFVNHSAFGESMLIKVLKVVDEKTGEVSKINSVDELGGFFKPGESFRLKMDMGDTDKKETCEFTKPERNAMFEGKKLEIDWEIVEDLFHKFDERIAKRTNTKPKFENGL